MTDLLDGIRINPQSLEAECAVLGAPMLDRGAAIAVVEALKPEQLYRPLNRKILAAYADLLQNGEPVDIVSTYQWLCNRGQGQEIGGMAYLDALRDACSSPSLVPHYLGIIVDKATRRDLIEASDAIKDLAYEQDMAIPDVLAASQQRIMAVGGRSSQSPSERSERLAGASAVSVLDDRDHAGDLPGVGTGFRDLDELTNGFKPGHLIVVAGPSSSGKSAFAFNVAEYVAAERDQRVLIFSLEMTGEELFERMVCSRAAVNSRAAAKGMVFGAEWRRLADSHRDLSQAPLLIDAAAERTVDQIRSRARRLVSEHGACRLIVVDYLHIIPKTSRGAGETAEELGRMAASLKAMGQELGAAVVLISETNREVGKREGHRPSRDDIGGSGKILYACDELIFIHRPEIYQDAKDVDMHDTGTSTAEIILAKQRGGPTGTVYLTWRGQFARFESQ